MDRFERQEILKGFGPEAQLKLRQARVLVVGIGGLGCPAVLYLSAAGVGTIGIADGDLVSLSNLNRQILFGIEDVGQLKASTAAALLRFKYPDIQYNVHPEFLHVNNAIPILENYDLIIDGTDNFSTRYLLNDACFLLKKPFIMASVYQNEGQLAVLNLAHKEHRPVHYRDIYPVPPGQHQIPNCNDTGVLGVLPGILGTLQAAESLKILSGFGVPLSNKMIHYHLMNSTFYEVDITLNPEADLTTPKNFEELFNTDYILNCGGVKSIIWQDAMYAVKEDKYVVLVDVREKDELPSSITLNCIQIPMGQIEDARVQLQPADSIILFCQTGIRSHHAALKLKTIFPNKHIYSIDGGIRNPDAPL